METCSGIQASTALKAVSMVLLTIMCINGMQVKQAVCWKILTGPQLLEGIVFSHHAVPSYYVHSFLELRAQRLE